MKTYRTAKVAEMLGTSVSTLNRYIAAKKVSPHRAVFFKGEFYRTVWTERDVSRARSRLSEDAKGRRKPEKKS